MRDLPSGFPGDSPVVLLEGAVIERVRREWGGHFLHPHVLNAAMVLSPETREILSSVYRQYIGTALNHGLPLVLMTPTWRAGPDRAEKGGFNLRRLNREACAFMREVMEEAGAGGQLYLAGLMGCRGDAYRPSEGLCREEARIFHRRQAEFLAESGVDLLMAATLPALSEAVGMAEAMTATGLPCVISFVLGASGDLLDGSSLSTAIGSVESEIAPKSCLFMINCTHPSRLTAILRRGRDRGEPWTDRVSGLQANASRRSPEELDGMESLDSGDPVALARDLVSLHREFGLRFLGGCCGTDRRHIEALAAELSK